MMTLLDPMDRGWDFPVRNTGVGCHFLLQGIFPTQESNLGLLPCRQILNQLSYKGSPDVSCVCFIPIKNEGIWPGGREDKPEGNYNNLGEKIRLE